MQKMVLFASETWSGVSAPIQYAAIEGYLQHDDVEQYVADCREIHGIRTRYIRSALVQMGITCTSAQGGFYIAANFDEYSISLNALGLHTAADLSTYLLQEYRIATLPGSDFGIPSTTFTLRLSTSYLDMENEADPQRIFDLYKACSDPSSLMSVGNHPTTHAALAAFHSFIQSIGES